MQANLFEPNSKEPYSSSKIEIKFSLRLFTSFIKRDIRHFAFVVVQWWQIKKLQKIVMHSQSCCLTYSVQPIAFLMFSLFRPRGILKSRFTNCGVVQINDRCIYIYIYIYIYIGTGSDRLYEHLRAKEGGKEKKGFSSSHGPLCFITSHSRVNRVLARLCAKNEAPAWGEGYI